MGGQMTKKQARVSTADGLGRGAGDVTEMEIDDFGSGYV